MDEIIEEFFDHSFEDLITEDMFERDYVFPQSKVEDYVMSIVSTPYQHFIDYVCTHYNPKPIENADIPQISNYEASTINVCQVMRFRDNPGMDCLEIGKALFTDDVERKEGAYFKFGENQVKGASFHGLTHCYYKKWFLTCLGYIYPELDDELRQYLAARTLLRNPFFHLIISEAKEKDVNIKKYMSGLSPSTQIRRSSSCMHFFDVILRQCQLEGVSLHSIFFDKNDVSFTTNANESKPADNTSLPDRQRNKSKNIYVLLPNGNRIMRKNAIDTFVATLQYIGLERVATFKDRLFCGYPLVGKEKRIGDNKWQKEVDGWYVYTYMSNDTKIELLKALSDSFSLDLTAKYEDGQDEVINKKEDTELVLSNEGKTFYDPLTRLQTMKVFHANDQLVALAEDLSDYTYNQDHCLLRYTKQIMNIRQAKIHGEVIVAKPVLLLAVIDGIEEGVIQQNMVHLNNRLEQSYEALMHKYTQGSIFKGFSPISNPFWHLQSDGFWHLYFNIHPPKTIYSPSLKWINDNVRYAYFDESLWQLLKDTERRNKLREFIIEHKLPQIDTHHISEEVNQDRTHFEDKYNTFDNLKIEYVKVDSHSNVIDAGSFVKPDSIASKSIEGAKTDKNLAKYAKSIDLTHDFKIEKSSDINNTKKDNVDIKDYECKDNFKGQSEQTLILHNVFLGSSCEKEETNLHERQSRFNLATEMWAKFMKLGAGYLYRIYKDMSRLKLLSVEDQETVRTCSLSISKGYLSNRQVWCLVQIFEKLENETDYIIPEK